MAWVDLRLNEGAAAAEEGCLSKHKVHRMDAASICRRVYEADSLIQQEEEEADKASEGIVGGEAFSALVPVVHEQLEGKRAAE